jgi:hypothetical protein
LEAYVERNVEAGRLEFTTDVQKAVDHGRTARPISSMCWLSLAPLPRT